MEKKTGLTRSEIIKWVILIASVVSAFAANQYDIRNHKHRIDDLERKIERMQEIQSEAAQEVANMNGKLDQINENVNVIKNAIIERGLSSSR